MTARPGRGFLVMLCAVASVAGCAASGPEADLDYSEPGPAETVTAAAFARTAADVAFSGEHFADDVGFTAPLVFVAPEADPIWTELSAVVLPDGPEVKHAVEPGASTPSGRLGVLSLHVTEPAQFDQVDLYLGAERASVDVGSWTVGLGAADVFEAQTGGTAMSSCGSLDTTLVNTTDHAVIITGISLGAPGLSLGPATLGRHESVPPSGAVDVVLDIRCDGEVAEIFLVSPRLEVLAEDGTDLVHHLEPIDIGTMSVDDGTAAHIVSR